MTRNGFRIMDSDLHILEPADLWERYIDPAFRDRAPRGLTDVTRGLGVDAGGSGTGHAAEGIERKRRDYSTYLQHEHYAEVERRNYDGVAMLGAMDREGLDLAVLYPSRGLLIVSIPGLDPELFGAISRAYNDWLHDLCLTDPDRLFGAAMVPATDVEAAVAEARRVAEEYGFKAIFLSADVYDQRGWDDPILLSALGRMPAADVWSSASIRPGLLPCVRVRRAECSRPGCSCTPSPTPSLAWKASRLSRPAGCWKLSGPQGRLSRGQLLLGALAALAPRRTL